MNIYEEKDYRACLKKLIQEKKLVSKNFSFSNLALSVQVAKSYLSKTIHLHTHLNRDQMYSACEFLNLSEKETDFLLLLHDFQNSDHQKRRKILKQKLDAIVTDTKRIEHKLTAKQVTFTDQELMEYYSDPYFAIVHIALTIKRYAEAPILLARDLKISNEKLGSLFAKLEKLKLISRNGKSIDVLETSLHLPKDSPLSRVSRTLLKLLTIERQNHIDTDNNRYYWVTFTANTENQQKIWQKLQESLREIEVIVHESPSEHVYYLGMDLLPLT